MAELVVNWTIHQPGITAALCGAKRPEQIARVRRRQRLAAHAEQLAQIDQALAERPRRTSARRYKQ